MDFLLATDVRGKTAKSLRKNLIEAIHPKSHILHVSFISLVANNSFVLRMTIG